MRFCPSCGSRLRASARRACPGCGARLEEAQDPQVKVRPERTLAGSFPYRSMRPYQGDVLEKIGSALDSGKRFVILEAPVGFGKSAVAAALCGGLRSAYVLTSTKQLQDQYSSDFGFNTVMGKSNFTCLVPTSSGRTVACNKGRCEADWSLSDCPHYLSFEQYEDHLRRLCDRDSKCEKTLRTAGGGRICPYYKQKWDSLRKDVAVGNYSFFFSELRFTDDLRKRRLLVCDEAHDLERQLVEASQFTLRASAVRQLAASPSGERLEFSVPLKEGMDSDAGKWLGPLVSAKEALEAFRDSHEGDPALQDRLVSCADELESLEAFLDDLKASPENWVVSRVRRAETVEGAVAEEATFQPLDVARYTSALFETAETVLLMSATIFSEALLCRTLGIQEEEAAFVRVSASSFPVENRRIFPMNVAQLNRATMDASMEGIARAVEAILDRHAGERGVVHTTSYPQAQYITSHVSETSKARLVTTEGSLNRSELLRAHGEREASVLISPSLHQGVDLKDELARFQVIVKVPFPDLSDQRTRVKKEKDPGWYRWQTALRLVQTYGRGVRSETDHAATYVLDSNFAPFVRDNRSLFPQYFLDALSDPATA